MYKQILSLTKLGCEKAAGLNKGRMKRQNQPFDRVSFGINFFYVFLGLLD